MSKFGLHTESIIMGAETSRLSSIIFFLICLLPVFSTVLFGAVDNTTWVFIAIIWAAIILLWLADAWKGGGVLINTSSLQLPLIGLLLIGLIQLLPLGGGAEGLSVPASQALSLDPYSTRFFITKLAVYVVFFAACLTFINNERRLRMAVLMLIIFGSLMAFFGILQRLASPEGIYGLRETPQSIPFGPFVNQHHFAAFMQMTGGLSMALLVGKTTEKDKKILLAIPVLIMGVATVLTGSRGGLLGFFGVGAFILLLNFLSGRWSRTHSDDADSSGVWRRNMAIAAAGVALVLVVFGVVFLRLVFGWQTARRRANRRSLAANRFAYAREARSEFSRSDLHRSLARCSEPYIYRYGRFVYQNRTGCEVSIVLSLEFQL